MSKPNILFHVGYHKTATTWMQKKFFVPHHGYVPVCGHGEVSEHIVAPHGLEFSPREMRERIERIAGSLSSSRVGVISSELLCGNPLFGGRESDVFARRLHGILPNARILLTIRAQENIIVSTYMQYLSRGGTMTAEEFFSGAPDFGYYSFDPSHFEFDRLVLLYQQLFGREKVYVATQESIALNPDAVCREISGFCGNSEFSSLSEDDTKRVGVSYPEYAVPFLRRINHIRKSTLNRQPVVSLSNRGKRDFLYRFTGFLFRKPMVSSCLGRFRPVTSYVRDAFSGRFRDSNRRLKDAVFHDLDLTGYDF